MTLLLADPAVAAVPVLDTGEPLVPLDPALSPAEVRVRRGLADRLQEAAARLPAGIRLLVLEGHRQRRDQLAIQARYQRKLRRVHGDLAPSRLRELSSRFVAPVEVAPHVAGAAVDLTLIDVCGEQLDLGSPVDATPEDSRGRCYFAATGISPDARAHRDLLAHVLGGAGLVNYPTEWWHWSYGDRYWALITGAPHALYGPVTAELAA